jgi:Fe2+ transport system protein B
MSKQNTTKETLDQMVETNKNMEHNTAMENTYNLDTKQLMTNKKADLVAMNLQHKAEIEELRAMIADLKATATKPNEVDYRRMLKDEVVRATKKAEKATATKTTKKATKKSKKTATKSKTVVAEKPTKLTKEENHSFRS